MRSAGVGAGDRSSLLEVFLLTLEKRCAAVSLRIASLGVVTMLAVSCVIVSDVTARWLLHTAIDGLNEIVELLFAVAISACIPAGLASGTNLTINILENSFSARAIAWFRAIGMFALLIFFVVLAWQLGVHASILVAEQRTTITLEWPVAPFMIAATILIASGAAIQAVVTAAAFVQAARDPSAAAAHVARGHVGRQVGAARSHRGLLMIITAVFAVTGAAFFAGALNFDGASAWTKENRALAVGLGFIALWGLLLGFMPIAAVMGIIGLGGSLLLLGPATTPALTAFSTEIATFISSGHVAVLPLFLLMGSFAAVAGLSDDIYSFAEAIFGRFRAGLALATIAGCAGFGAVTGSSVATAATVGRISLPQMKARGYSAGLSTGSIAAGGTLGQLVPPSTAIVIFSLLTEASIGQLFVAAVIPAAIAVAFYLCAIAIHVKLAPESAPPVLKTDGGNILRATKRCGGVLILFAAVIGGLYFGVFTATESASVGALGAFLFALARGRLNGGMFWKVMGETTSTTAMIYCMIFGALTFSFFVGVSGLPVMATEWIVGLDLSAIGVIIALLVGYVLLGAIMDSFAVMVITTPIVVPLVLDMGYDLVWWGILMVVVVETGMITPPFGLNLFVIKTFAPDVPLGTIFRGVMPFVISDFIRLALLIAVPALVLYLPSTMN